ncbi:hypothetical protein ACKU27_16375 [Sphingobium yanoikuyae]|jgi:opacity protein-like surface antigen|uniref:Outer membrane protein beta-barrel domain-containing protein n=1 Tax=Sphingobium yanoikuyae TaxID=13690 RepID=A0A430C7K1_SPHYA|nr:MULTISPECIES: hypothetical protein [Sphingobium]MBR2270072.1 hypothetical protein [Sphingobium sp.]RSU60833.1 hypothetical protein DAH51_03970 [Sphingobium yanoikuyae]
MSDRPVLALLLCLAATTAPVRAAEEEKSSDDPTKIATKVGITRASDEFSLSGSVAVGPKLKFNARVSESGLWSVGASYLLPVAILTFSAGKSHFDSGVEQTRYSLGGFVPLSQIGLKTGKLQIFVPFGYTYTNGHGPVSDIDQSDGLPIALSSNSGYAGLFLLRPLGPKLTAMAGGNVTKGTHDFSGVALGGGLSYHLTRRDTVGANISYVDNSFGTSQKLRFSYRHEF